MPLVICYRSACNITLQWAVCIQVDKRRNQTLMFNLILRINYCNLNAICNIYFELTFHKQAAVWYGNTHLR